MKNLKTIIITTAMTAFVAACVPLFFAIVCYSDVRSDCGWLSAVPFWSGLGAFSGLILGFYIAWDNTYGGNK